MQKNVQYRKRKSLDFCELALREDYIVQINIFAVKEITEKEVEIMIVETLILTNGKLLPILIFVDDFVQFSKDAREYSASMHGKRTCIAEAFVINNLGHLIIGNFYMRINNPVKPVAFFKKEKEALCWLKKQNLITHCA